MLVKNIIL